MKKNLGWISILCAGVVCFCSWLSWVEPGFFRMDDNSNLFLTNFYFNWQVLKNYGELAQVNFYQFGGNEQLGQGQSSVLYVGAYVFQWLSEAVFGYPWYGVEMLLVSNFMMGGVGMYLWLKENGVRGWLAVISVWVWLSLPYIVGTSRSWLIMSYVVGFGPWIFWQMERWLLRKKWAGLGVVVMLVGLGYTGYVHWLVSMGVFMSLYVLVWLIFKRVRMDGLKRLVVEYVCLMGLSGLLLAPQLVPVWASVRESVSRNLAVRYEGFVEHSVGWRDWLGAQVFVFREDVFRGVDAQVYFLGLVLLVVVVGSIWSDKVRRLGVIGLLAGVFSTEVFGIFYKVPFLNTIRWPYKNYVFVGMFLIVGFGVVLDHWWKVGRRKWVVWVLGLSLVSNLVVVWSYRGVESAFFPRRVEVSIDERVFEEVMDTKGRVLTYKVEEVLGMDQSLLLGQNFASVFGAFSVSGYDPVVSSVNERFALGLNGQGSYESDLSKEGLDYFSSRGVRYVVSIDRSEVREELESLGLNRVGKVDEVVVYENERAWPLVGWVDDMDPVEFEVRGNKLVVGELETEDTRWLLFNLAPVDRYKAMADGELVSSRVVGAGVEVRVPKGVREVELVYKSPGFGLGMWLAGLGVLLGWLFRKSLLVGEGMWNNG